MKRIIVLCAVAIMAVCLSSCNTGSNSSDSADSLAPTQSELQNDEVNISGFQGGWLYKTLVLENFQPNGTMNVNDNSAQPNPETSYSYTRLSDTTAKLTMSFPWTAYHLIYKATFNLTFNDAKGGTYKGTETVAHTNSAGAITSTDDYILNDSFSIQ